MKGYKDVCVCAVLYNSSYMKGTQLITEYTKTICNHVSITSAYSYFITEMKSMFSRSACIFQHMYLSE